MSLIEAKRALNLCDIEGGNKSVSDFTDAQINVHANTIVETMHPWGACDS